MCTSLPSIPLHHTLTDRELHSVINGSGEPVVGDFWKIVESEHCRRPDSSKPFLTSNYGITTTPAQEWEITTKQNASLADMRHDRRLPNPEDLLRSDLSKRAGLTLIEVVVLVLYTGPMVGYRARVPPPSAPAPAPDVGLVLAADGRG